MNSFDVAIIGAGAAGLFCAGVAGQLGLKVLLIDHSEKVAEKIRISGGGRANFTNRDITAANFLSDNPKFCRSALANYTPQHFIELMNRHGIAFHEKHKGQLFCDRSAEDLITMLLAECAAGGVTRWQPCQVVSITQKEVKTSISSGINSASNPIGTSANSYEINSNRGIVHTRAVVVATGGLSIPKIGATDFGYRIAGQFGLNLIEPRPALVPLTFDGEGWAPYASLSGLSLPVQIETSSETGSKKSRIIFNEDLLFTHRGLSGPAVLQISSFWKSNTPIRVNFAPTVNVADQLAQAKSTSKKRVANELAGLVPSRLADAWVGRDAALQRPINEAPDKALATLAEHISRWDITPTGTEGYKKAEVTAGGVDTRELSSQTMESRQPGLYFIGEVVDVTGWLGGYNFQWAWASAFACAHGLAAKLAKKS
jgi:predicted Rossmann fold flavoprotein